MANQYNGPRIDGSRVRIWATKADAIKGAKAIGWAANSVARVHTRFCLAWALYFGPADDTSGAYLSRERYGELYHNRNGAPGA